MLRLQPLVATALGFAALASAALDCKTGASNGTVFTSGTNTYDILCNYQYGGDSIGASKKASTFDICVGYCDTTNGCVDVVYDGAQYCYLKSSKTNGYASPNWYTAVKRTTATTGTTTAAPTTTTTSPSSSSTAVTGPNCVDGSSNGTVYNSGTAQYDILCGYQYNGAALGGSKYADTFATCVGFCDTTAGCVDVVYSSAKYCFLKSTKLSGYSSPGWYVAVKRAGPGPNLLQNPSFETTSSEAWVGTPGITTYYVYQPAAYDGSVYEILYSGYTFTPILNQTLTGLDTTKSYSLSFYYSPQYMFSYVAGRSCIFTASVGGTTVFTKSIVPSDINRDTYVYVAVTVAASVRQTSQVIQFKYDCTTNGGTDFEGGLFIDAVSFNTV